MNEYLLTGRVQSPLDQVRVFTLDLLGFLGWLVEQAEMLVEETTW